MANVLILGGTRNLGHVAALALLERNHNVTILNRGQTADELPADVERLRADRNDSPAMQVAIGSRDFDLILDNTTYTEADAKQAVELFTGRTRRYVFVSSGQVYLVRENLDRPFRESDYDGAVMAEPPRESADHPSWLYGVDKRDAEKVFDASTLPVTTLRLPMVASERDHYGRIQGYVARLLDGKPILIPDENGLPIRHVYVRDVADLVANLIDSGAGINEAFNISWGESMSLEEFLEALALAAGAKVNVNRVPCANLEAKGLLPDCSPFSGKWMSELDNSRSLDAFRDAGISYTSPAGYLPLIVDDYIKRWQSTGLTPDGYRQRSSELEFPNRSS
jgi:nucleoside-diphosphate-sugar epimerase